MSVYFNKEAAQLQLNTAESSYVMQIHDGLLLHLYWGPRLDDRDHSYMHWEQGRAAFSCRMETAAPDSRRPAAGVPDLGPGATTARPRRRSCTRTDEHRGFPLRLAPHSRRQGAAAPAFRRCTPTRATTCRRLKSCWRTSRAACGCRCSTRCFTSWTSSRATPYSPICRRATSSWARRCRRRSTSTAPDLDVITNYGTHCVERQIERGPLRRGKTVLASRRGASSPCT